MRMDNLPIISFKTSKEFGKWLSKNHAKTGGIWLRFFKKASDEKSIYYSEALDEALCYGWIDGQVKKYDEQSYIQRFTPRRTRSIWSKRNTEHIARLEKEGKMKPSGIGAVEAAKADGRWDAAYDSPSNMQIPPDFLKELSKNKKAKDFFENLSKSNKYAIAWRLSTAKKPQTKEKRMKDMLQMLKEGKKLH